MASDTFTHTGGFGDNPTAQGLGSLRSGRFAEGTEQGGDNGAFMFAVVLMLAALFFLGGGNNQRASQTSGGKPAANQANGNRRYHEDSDFYDE